MKLSRYWVMSSPRYTDTIAGGASQAPNLNTYIHTYIKFLIDNALFPREET